MVMLIAGESTSSSSIVMTMNITDMLTETKFGMGWHETDLLPKTLTRQLMVCFQLLSTAPYETNLTASKDLLALDARLPHSHHPCESDHLSTIRACVSNQKDTHYFQDCDFLSCRFWSVGCLECLDTLHPYRQSLASTLPRTLCEERDTVVHQRRRVYRH